MSVWGMAAPRSGASPLAHQPWHRRVRWFVLASAAALACLAALAPLASADTPLVANIPENLDAVVRQLQR